MMTGWHGLWCCATRQQIQARNRAELDVEHSQIEVVAESATRASSIESTT